MIKRYSLEKKCRFIFLPPPIVPQNHPKWGMIIFKFQTSKLMYYTINQQFMLEF